MRLLLKAESNMVIYYKNGYRPGLSEEWLLDALQDYVKRAEESEPDGNERKDGGKWTSDTFHEVFQIRRERHGRPYAAQRPDLSFSVTHTEDWWICAVGRAEDGPLGIDAEKKTRTVKKPAVLARRFFHEEEAARVEKAAAPDIGGNRVDSARAGKNTSEAIDAGDGANVSADHGAGAAYVKIAARGAGGNGGEVSEDVEADGNIEGKKRAADLFINIWVRKEAYLKYTGEGLSGLSGDCTVTFAAAASETKGEDESFSDGIAEDASVEFVTVDLDGELCVILCRGRASKDKEFTLCRLK